MYDIAILGTGPAGISAAITSKIRNKSILFIGSRKLSDKIRKAHQIQNYPGIPDITGVELAEKLSGHLECMNISINEERAVAVYAMGNYFGIQTDKDMYEAHAVILATGILHGKAISGEKEFLGRGVSYCATCDASLYKNKTVAVIGYQSEYEAEADFLAEIAEKVYYFPMYHADIRVSEKVIVRKEAVIEIVGDNKVTGLKTTGRSYETDGVFVLRDSIAPDRLVPGVTTDGNHILVNMQMETNIPGCFACGDITGKPYQYIKAAGQGNVAALSAVNYLDKINRHDKEKEM